MAIQNTKMAELLASRPEDDGFDRVVRLTQAVFGSPIAALNLIGEDTQFTVAAAGIGRQVWPKEQSVCQYTVQGDDVLEIQDMREDDRTKDLEVVAKAPRVRYYAGVPLKSTAGQTIGALCFLDLVPRTLGRQQMEMLEDLGAVVEREIAVQEEMLNAGEVQRQLLPASDPVLPGYQMHGRVKPYKEAGGDFYDYLFLENPGHDDDFQILLADVMGKGLAASLIASEVRAVVRGHSRYDTVNGTMARVSKTVLHDLEANNRFVTMWIGRLEPHSGRLDWIDIGHGLAVIMKADGSIKRLYMKDYLPLGLPMFVEGWRYESEVLEPGDQLVVVSDGVFDVFDDDMDAFMAMAPTLFDKNLDLPDLVDSIIDYATLHDTTDDVTVIVLRRTDADAADLEATKQAVANARGSAYVGETPTQFSADGAAEPAAQGHFLHDFPNTGSDSPTSGTGDAP